MASVNATRERLARVPAILKRFRQAVLAAACSGRLTTDWRREHAFSQSTADQIPFRGQNTITTEIDWCEPNFDLGEKRDLPNGWIYVALGNLGNWVGGGTPSKSNGGFWKNGTIPWLSPKDMKVERIQTTEDHITENAAVRTRLKILPPKTLLFVVRGMILAHTFPVALTSVPLTVNQDIRAIIPFVEGVRPEYLFRALQAQALSILFAVRESTHGTRRLESETLKCWPIPIPPLEEQSEIDDRVNAFFKLADTIERRVATATARADKLTQAILAKAFRGELVPTEAELARSEGRAYESASDLLARIQSERSGLIEQGGASRKNG